MPPIQVEQTFGLRPVKVLTLGNTQVTEQAFHDFLAQISPRFTPETYDLFTNNCNNFSNEAATFLLGSGIPDDIINLPQEFLSTPMGQMLRPMLQTTQDQLNSRFEQQGNRMNFNGAPNTGTRNPLNVSNNSNNQKANDSTTHEYIKPDFKGQELMAITIKTR